MILHGLEGDAVIFDCDGVLVDSEPVSYAAWSATLAALGFVLTEEAFSGSVGGTEAMVAEAFAPMVAADPVALETDARYRFERLAGSVRSFADAREAIERIESKGVPIGVATNGLRWRLDVLLAGAGLERLRPTSVTADEVQAPKPAPDLYVAAARLVEVDPERCVVVEDSPTGIAAAKAAGCKVVAVDRGMFPSQRLIAADVVVERV